MKKVTRRIIAKITTIVVLCVATMSIATLAVNGAKSSYNIVGTPSVVKTTRLIRSYKPSQEDDLTQQPLVTGSYATIHNFTYEEAQMLMKLAYAEAGVDGQEGMAAVMMVVVNRVADPNFPNSIKEVIFQKNPVQFSSTVDGNYDKADPDSDCHLALAGVEAGNYNYIQAIYFENAKSSWQSKKCEYLYTIGHHRFYK